MGCGGSKGVKYEFEGKTHTIPADKAKTIQKISLYGIAKLKMKVQIIRNTKAITNLPKPMFVDGKLVGDPQNPLLNMHEFENFKYYNFRDKKYIWDNTLADIKGADFKYRGQRLKSDISEYEGLGEFKYKDGNVYRGFSENKTYNGKGRMDYKNGDYYQGMWKDGHYDGKGTYFNKEEGSIYDGDYVNEVQHGKGKKQWNYGEEEYEGDWNQGEKTGKGRFTKKNGDIYQGDFVKGEMTGEGKYFLAESEAMFEGTFNKGVMTRGKVTYKDGQIYQGQLKNWKKHGQGNLKLTNGGHYVGTWDKDNKNGLLTLFKDNYKQREQYQNGTLKDVIKTPCAPGELQKQLENPGYGIDSKKKGK